MAEPFTHITPSNLSSMKTDFRKMVDGNHSLKVGQVTAVTFPDDNQSPPFPLYTVLIKEVLNNALVEMILTNCILKDTFGSTADFFEYSLRTNQYDVSQGNPGLPPQDKLLGANVLVECINGQTIQGVILGAVRTFRKRYSPEYIPVTDKTGKYLQFNFNGIGFQINNDGELTLIRTGPSANDGSTLTQDADGNDYEKDNPGSTISINKLGDINISSGTNDEDTKYTPQILLNKTGKITIASGQDNDQTDLPNNSMVFNSDGSVNVTIDNGDNLKLAGKNDDATLTLGDGANSAAIAEKLQTYINNLVQQIGLTISTAQSAPGAAGGPLVIAIQPSTWPQWDPNIASASVKVPK